jgi:DNA N-6-adenine-methyltransferase Dam
MKGQDVLFSHKSDNYITPKWLIDELLKEFPITLDVCTTKDNPLNIKEFFWYPEWDGLHLCNDWQQWNYCNPPYSEIYLWCERASHEWLEGNNTVMLLPARTGTKWFHRWIYDKKGYGPRVGREIRLLEGRLKFQGTKNSAPFDSMVVIFR